MTACMVTQYLEPEYWNWTQDELQQMQQFKAQGVGNVINQRLAAAGIAVEELHAILHDRDEREGSNGMEFKPEHVHIAIKFADRVTISTVAAAVGVEQQYVEKPGRGRYAWDNMLSYLTHIKYEDKFQYAPEDVLSWVIEGKQTFQQIYAERSEAWMKGRASVKKKRAKNDVDYVAELAMTGKITKQEILLDDQLYTTWAHNQRVIDDALSAYASRRAAIAAEKLARGEFSTTVLYVTGPPGAGKTWCANYLVDQYIRVAAAAGETWQVYRAASSNPLDDWHGEEILLLDDLRAEAMGAEDWLALLDPANSSPASARYRNKQNVAPRVIVMTAHMEPVTFFRSLRSEYNEPLDQFIRRLTGIIQVKHAEDYTQRFQYHVVGRLPQIEMGAQFGVIEKWAVDSLADLAKVSGQFVVTSNGDIEMSPPPPAQSLVRLEIEPPPQPGPVENPWEARGQRAY